MSHDDRSEGHGCTGYGCPGCEESMDRAEAAVSERSRKIEEAADFLVTTQDALRGWINDDTGRDDAMLAKYHEALAAADLALRAALSLPTSPPAAPSPASNSCCHEIEMGGPEDCRQMCPNESDLWCPSCKRLPRNTPAWTMQGCPECRGTGKEGTGTPSGEGGEDFRECFRCQGSGFVPFPGAPPVADTKEET